jgi:type I restriction enzyme M protein
MPNVSNLIKTIQDIMRKDAGVDGDAQRLAQLGWMFFLKIFDDRETQLELFDDAYRSPLAKHLRWRTWASDAEGITGDALLDFVNNTLLPKLKTLPGGGEIGTLIRAAFDGANNYMKNGTLMRQVINKINGIDFNSTDDRHLFGDIYEKLLKDLQSAGNAGEFYTPRAVTQFIVEQVNPRLDRRETVLDPACGTGGFLVCAIEHLRKQAKTEADERALQTCFAGIEKKHLPHVLCMTNLLLHGIDVPSNVRHDNTLARPLRDWGPKERVDVIVTNPPFGGMEEDGIEANYPAEFRTRETADLFLVLLMKLLKPGGRAGLVLPDGTLFGEGVKTRIKEALLSAEPRADGPGHVYRALSGAGSHRDAFTRLWPAQATHIRAFLDELRSWKTERCERFATLYAAWNDLLIWGQEPTDAAILEQVLEKWDPAKKRIPRDLWLDSLRWMRDHGYTPTGFGRATQLSICAPEPPVA